MICECVNGGCNCRWCASGWNGAIQPIGAKPWCERCGGTGVFHCCEGDQANMQSQAGYGLTPLAEATLPSDRPSAMQLLDRAEETAPPEYKVRRITKIRKGNRDQIALERMTEGEMIIQGLREAVEWSRENKPHTQETGETDAD